MSRVTGVLGRALCLSAVMVLVAGGCASYQGTAVSAERRLPQQQPGWVWVNGVPEVRQTGEKDCGPAALSAVLAYWGHPVPSEEIRTALGRGSGERVQAKELTTYAQGLGFDAYVLKGAMTDVVSELRNGRPVIVGVAKRYGQDVLAHYEVVVGVQPSSQATFTLDPADGWLSNTSSGFMAEWEPTGRVMIVVFPAPHARQEGGADGALLRSALGSESSPGYASTSPKKATSAAHERRSTTGL